MKTTFFPLKTSLRGLLVLLVFVLAPSALAQTSQYEVVGRVFDEPANAYLEGATVRLLNATNGKLVKGAMTDKNGRFSLKDLQRGSYRLSVTFIGLKDAEKNISLDKTARVDLGTIRMADASQVLGGVEITATATPVRMKQDTVEFNAGSFKVREGAVVEELLKKLPGVEVDSEGNITYNGEKIEKIEVDGRNFFSNDPKMATRNLPSLMVDRVQVVDKQSDESQLTGMDDGSRTKVLNLSLKKDMKKGLVSNYTAAYGTSDRYLGSLMMNYFNGNSRYTLTGNANNLDGILMGRGDIDSRRVGLNYETTREKVLAFTAEAGYDGNNNTTTGSTLRENLLSGGSQFYKENYSNISRSDRAHGSSRLEWTPNKETTVFFTPNFSYSRSHSTSTQAFNTRNASDQEINNGTSKIVNDNTSLSLSGELHARHTLSPEGRHIYVGLEGSYNNSNGSGTNLSTTTYSQPGKAADVIDQHLNNESSSRRLSLHTSYIEPLSPLWALQFTYRINLDNRKSAREAFTADALGNYSVLDEVYTRYSTSSSRDHVIGANLRYKVGLSQITMGMEARPSYASTQSWTGSTLSFDKSRVVWNYAPSVRLEYRNGTKGSFNLRYNGRTSHPSMDQLNPAAIINTPLMVTQGNPDLLPAFSHNLRFNGNINRMEKRQTFGVMSWISYTNNAVVDRRTIDRTTGQTKISYENVSGLLNANIGGMMSTPIGGVKSNWTFFLFGRVGYNIGKSYVNGEINTSHVLMPMFGPRITWSTNNLSITLGGRGMIQKIDNTLATSLNRTTTDYTLLNEINWKLPWSIDFSSNYALTSKSGYSGGLDGQIHLWDLTLGKSFLKNNAATIEVSVYDVLGQRRNFSRFSSANTITDSTINGITTYGMLTFKLRFNSFGKGNEPQGAVMSDRRYGPFHGPGGPGSGRRF